MRQELDVTTEGSELKRKNIRGILASPMIWRRPLKKLEVSVFVTKKGSTGVPGFLVFPGSVLIKQVAACFLAI